MERSGVVKGTSDEILVAICIYLDELNEQNMLKYIILDRGPPTAPLWSNV